ncbi:MAG: hypothetical protein KDN20_16000, partial [Verrucomicrobiae bacterium]|nr:hypothetical protein [Verrucomicrobiae bacterium]
MNTTLEAPVPAHHGAPPSEAPDGSAVAATAPGGASIFGADDPFGAGLMSLEGTAVQFGIIPAKLPRETCSVEAEAILRKIGRFPQSEAPWLPIASLGPLLIFAHHNPKVQDMWGVPSCFAIRIAISSDQYEAIRKDLVMRLQSSPLSRTNRLESLPSPDLAPDALDDAFFWLLQHYPFDHTERDRLEMLQGELAEKQGRLDRKDYDSLMPSLGVALQYLIDGSTRLCFNPDESARQDAFPVPLLEKHNVFPLYCGDNHIYLLTAELSNYGFEDE